MKYILPLLLLFSLSTQLHGQKQQIVTSDIDHFWQAYDQISKTKDSVEQYKLLQELYLDKASEGLKALMEVRRYTPQAYLEAINRYPKFWNSIRKNTFKSKKLSKEISGNVEKLRQLYPSLKPSTIYFSVGVFRTNGTIRGNNVLIGSEMALSGKNVDVSELPEHPKEFNRLYNPIMEIGLLCTHEYIHTQQNLPLDNLLCNSLYEGVAEFISCLATGKSSNTPSFRFAAQNEEMVKRKFINDLFIPNNMYNWIWGNNENELKERDLGYYMGYRICEEYLKRSADKQKAIREMIELDYTNDQAVETFVNQSGYFSQSVQELYDAFEKSRPTVIHMAPFENGSKEANPHTKIITLNFSEPMNPDARGFDYGPLGESHVLMVQKVIGFSEDGKSFSFEVNLQPGKQYQSLVTNNFVSASGVPLKPYLIDFTTAPQGNPGKFEFIAEDVFTLSNNRIVVTGQVKSGSIKKSEKMVVKINNQEVILNIEVMEIFAKPGQQDIVYENDFVGFTFSGITKAQVRKGTVFYKL